MEVGTYCREKGDAGGSGKGRGHTAVGEGGQDGATRCSRQGDDGSSEEGSSEFEVRVLFPETRPVLVCLFVNLGEMRMQKMRMFHGG